jgi:hypothetical protein
MEIWKNKVHSLKKIAAETNDIHEKMKQIDLKIEDLFQNAIVPFSSKNLMTKLTFNNDTIIVASTLKLKDNYSVRADKIDFHKCFQILHDKKEALIKYIPNKDKQNLLRKFVRITKKLSTAKDDKLRVEEKLTAPATYIFLESEAWKGETHKFDRVKTSDGETITFALGNSWDKDYEIQIDDLSWANLMVAQQHWGIVVRVAQEYNRLLKKQYKSNILIQKKLEKVFQPILVAKEL